MYLNHFGQELTEATEGNGSVGSIRSVNSCRIVLWGRANAANHTCLICLSVARSLLFT